MNIIRIKKIQEDCEIPTMNPNNTFDIRIHRFHKIDDYTGEIIEQNTQTYFLQSLKRVLITTGYAITYVPNNLLIEAKTRSQCAIKDGLIVLGCCIHNNELAVLLSLQSDSVVKLEKGFRIAVGMLGIVHEVKIEKI